MDKIDELMDILQKVTMDFVSVTTEGLASLMTKTEARQQMKDARAALRAEFERLQNSVKYLIKVRDDKQSWINEYYARDRETANKVIRLQQELDALKERTRWVPITERTPTRDYFYLVLEENNKVAGYYNWCREFGWNSHGRGVNIQTVTHWMELPKTPKAENAALKEQTSACKWTRSDDDYGSWSTDCGEEYIIYDGTPTSNDMRYCCYCGKQLHECYPLADPEDV